MKFKNKLAIISALAMFQFANVGAESVDDELALIAAEQSKENSEKVETFQPEKDETPQPVEEPPKVETPPPAEVPKVENPPVEKIPEVEQTPLIEKTEEVTTAPAVEQTPTENISNDEQAVGIPNPIIEHANFDDLVDTVNFVPLYIPKKSGYAVNSFVSIGKEIAEIRYGRRWEPEVELQVRTYKRKSGEETKDISGVYGVKWRMDMTSGIEIYLAKIDEKTQVAAWAVGDYTFSAYAKNLSFAGFHALVSEELVDLSNHYYLKVD